MAVTRAQSLLREFYFVSDISEQEEEMCEATAISGLELSG